MKAKNIKPLFDYLLVKPLDSETTTPSGIILPDTVKEKPQMGEILAVGDGGFDEDGKIVKMILKVGQKIMYKKWGGNEVKAEGQELMLIQQKDVLAIIS